MEKKQLLKILLIHKIWKKNKRKARTEYIRPIFRNRNILGERTLVEELALDPEYHFKYFRMDKINFDFILEGITAAVSHPNTHLRPISPLERLAITIRYLATGNSQASLAMNYRISPSSVSGILRETMTAICDSLAPTYLSTPNLETWRKSESDFANIWNFPNACGALDGKHVRIKTPSSSGSKFYNYKNYFSLVLLALSDAKYKFIYVDIGASGSQSDGGVLMKSTLGQGLENGDLGLPPPKNLPGTTDCVPHVLLGDDGFPLKTNLMRKFFGDALSLDEKIYNYRLSRARMTVECAFGILAARWRIFHSVMECDLDLAKLVIKTAVVLHNFLMTKKDMNSITIGREDENGDRVEGNWKATTSSDNGLVPLPRQGSNNYTTTAANERNSLKNYFSSDHGSLSWQVAYVNRGRRLD